MEPIIKTLTRESLRDKIGELFKLEYNWENIGDIPWTDRNFYLELPGKWEMSALAYANDKLVGYTIASLEDKTAKLNKIIVDSSFRKNGIATGLWDFLREKCIQNGADRLEFKVLEDNLSAIEFYKNKKCIFYGSSIGRDNKSRYDIRYVFKTDRIKHSMPTVGEEEAVAAHGAIINGDVNTKKAVYKFENKFVNLVGKKFSAATNSGTSALHLALRALNIKEGYEVIMTSYVCGSLLNAVNYCRSNPVIADINETDYNISLNDVKRKITKNTKAIILPHMFGEPAKNVEEFMKLHIPIIEDCALSVGGEHNGKKVGSFGDISIFSFYATKVITTGTGGMLMTDNEKIIERANDLLRYDNRTDFGESYNYGMNDIQASLGIVQLGKLDDFINRRKEIASTYSSLLADCKDIRLPEAKENIFFRYIIRSHNSDKLIENLRGRGVDASKPVFIPLHRYLNLSDEEFPNTTKAYREAVSIPIYPSLTKDDICDISSIILNSKEEGIK